MSDTLNPDQPDKESADTGARAEGEQSNAESRRAFIKKLAYTHLPCRLLSWSMAASRVMTTTTMVAARVGPHIADSRHKGTYRQASEEEK